MSGWPDHNTDHYAHWHVFMPVQETKPKNLRKSPQFPHGDNLPSRARQSCFTCHRQLDTDTRSLTPSQPWWLYQCHRQTASYRQLVLTCSQLWQLYQCHRQSDRYIATDNWSLTHSQPWWLCQCHRQTASYKQLVFNIQSTMTAISVPQTDSPTGNWSLTPN